MAKSLNAGIADSNDERGRRSSSTRQVETRIARRYQQTNDDHTSKVEKENTDIDTFNSFREVASRVLSFDSGNLRAVY